MTNFSDFGLAQPILTALAEEGYTTPTPIQLQSIPDVMAGRDLLGIAQTGTGKTAAFALPILHRLAVQPARPERRGCRVLVLSPTRELASQICESFNAYGRHLRLSSTVVFGGVPLGRQERALANGVDILVATPGRLLDLIDRRSLTLSGVEILVLDEADQMLDLGFIHSLRRVVQLVPKQRQTLFFSATMPKAIEQLSAQFITDPVRVAVTPVATTAERVEQSVIFVSTGDKPALLRSVLSDPTIDRTLVFTRTKHGADKVVRHLESHGIGGAAIHGNKSQGQRERALAAFRNGACRVLVATDIAARGIDVEGVSHVVNYDLPNVPEQYVHRIGRTARAGATGLAISFCNGEERAYLRDIEKLTRLKVPVSPLPEGFAATRAEAPSHEVEEPRREGAGRGRNGGRPSRGSNPASHGRPQGRPSQPARGRRQGQGGGYGAGQGGQSLGGQPREGSQATGAQNRDRQHANEARRSEGQRGPQGRAPSSDRSQRSGNHDGSSVAWLERARGPQR